MEMLLELLPEETVQKLKRVSKRLCLPKKEIVRRSVEVYIQRLVGFGMWKNRSEMSNSSEWVQELRKREWYRW